jgi:hypothetical protein
MATTIQGCKSDEVSVFDPSGSLFKKVMIGLPDWAGGVESFTFQLTVSGAYHVKSNAYSNISFDLTTQ